MAVSIDISANLSVSHGGKEMQIEAAGKEIHLITRDFGSASILMRFFQDFAIRSGLLRGAISLTDQLKIDVYIHCGRLKFRMPRAIVGRILLFALRAFTK